MIISVDEMMKYTEFSNLDSSFVDSKLKGIENLIRKYTNNNFQNRNVRFIAASTGSTLNGVSPFLRVGDTIQISESGVNDGLYVINEIIDTQTVIDEELFSVEHNLITKVEYPIDVKMGVVNLMKWEISNRDKVGIKAETISRHSVTYFDQDVNNTVMGYPVALLAFLKPYMKARF